MAYDHKECQKLLDDYTQTLQIDKNALDDELTEQPQLYYEIAHEYTRCMAMRDMKKQEYELTMAQVDRQLRERYAADNTKTTEKRIENEVLEHSSSQNAYSEFAMWRYLTESWEALVDATSARGYALRDLVSLHIAGYYANAPVKASETDRAVMRGHGR